jgi:DNA replication protein DnaC
MTALTHPTVERLHELGFNGMAAAFAELINNPDAASLAPGDWLGLLLDRESTWRQERRLKARLRYARLRHPQACVEDYRTPRGLDRALFHKLTTGQWIVEHRSLLVVGRTGTGKSWLSCALAQRACRDNYSVLYQRLPRLFPDLALARGDGRFPRLMRALGGVNLLVLDDWGPETLTPEQRRDLLEILEERYGRGSTIITSQIPIERWHDVIGDPTLADAILDRIVHNAYRIELVGESLRKPRTGTEK